MTAKTITGMLLAVTVAAAPSAFDVASVRLSRAPDAAVFISNGVDSASGRMRVQSVGGNVDMRNWTLGSCITAAWDLGPGQMSGPSWLNTDRYDIVARTSPQVNQAELRAMLQTLLIERFRLAVHHETREQSAYALVQAKSGIKLRPGQSGQQSAVLFAPPSSLIGRGSTMQGLALALARPAGRPVVDRTGVDGRFDFTLSFTPELTPGAVTGDGGAAAGPSIFTALQEQLGLRLESQKSQVDVLFVDHAERVPTEN